MHCQTAAQGLKEEASYREIDFFLFFSSRFMFLSHAALEAGGLAGDGMARFEVCFPTAQLPPAAQLSFLGPLQGYR